MDEVEKAILNMAYGLNSSMSEKSQIVTAFMALHKRILVLEDEVERLRSGKPKASKTP